MEATFLKRAFGIGEGWEYRSTKYVGSGVEVHVKAKREAIRCPKCEAEHIALRGTRERRIRQPDRHGPAAGGQPAHRTAERVGAHRLVGAHRAARTAGHPGDQEHQRLILPHQRRPVCAQRKPLGQTLRRREADIFGLQRGIVLYDVTNTHFEGLCEKNPKARHGKNKQKRNDCRQVAVGMAFDERRLALAHDVFEGNIAESKTLSIMLDRLEMPGDGLRPVVILDAGVPQTL